LPHSNAFANRHFHRRTDDLLHIATRAKAIIIVLTSLAPIAREQPDHKRRLSLHRKGDPF